MAEAAQAKAAPLRPSSSPAMTPLPRDPPRTIVADVRASGRQAFQQKLEESLLGKTLAAGALVWTAAMLLLFGGLMLMALGLGVEDLVKAVGAPLPTVHDDPQPDRVAWAGA